MKKNQLSKRLTTIGLGLIMLASCSPKEQTGYLSVYPGRFNVGPVAWSGTVTLKSSDTWYMVPIGQADWCNVYPDKGIPGDMQLEITVTPLEGTQPRTALFEVVSGSGIKRYLQVEQKDDSGNYYLDFAGNPDLSVSVPAFDVPPLKNLVLTNAGNWTVHVSPQAQGWLSAERKGDTLLIYVKDVDGPEGRSGTVTASAGGSIGKTLTLSQIGLHEFGAATRNFSLPIPGIPDSDLAFKYVYTRARITLLLIWGSWCGDCTAFMPSVKKLYEEFYDHGFKIYGVALEKADDQQAYFDYLEESGLDAVDEETGTKIWWENRPVFFPLQELKVNSFTQMFYGDQLLTGQIKNFIPAFFFVDAGGNIARVYADNYKLYNNSGNANSLYRNMRTFLSRQLECCGN